MKYRLKKADRLYMEGYKAALRDMYKEDFMDDAKKIRDSKRYASDLLGDDLSFAQDRARGYDKYLKPSTDKFSSDFSKWKDNQARRMNDGEFVEPDIYDPEYDDVMGQPAQYLKF
jgi:hypothetical protein